MTNYQDTAVSPSGIVVPNAQVSVFNAGLSSKPTIYSDAGITPLTNPFQADAQGRFKFYAANGKYDVQVSGPGIVTQTKSDIEIFDALASPTLIGNLVGNVTGTLTSPATNPAAVGEVKLATSDAINFRNAANSADVNGLSKNSSDVIALGGTGGVSVSGPIAAGTNSVISAAFISNTASPATTGQGRLADTDVIFFRNHANSANISALAKNSVDILLLGDAAGALANPFYTNSLIINAGTPLTTSNQTGTGNLVLATTPVLTNPSISGVISSYNGISTVSLGIPVEYAAFDISGLSADLSLTSLYSVPAGGTGRLYRVSVQQVVTQAATTSSTMPGVIISHTDGDNNAALSFGLASSSGNNLNTWGNQTLVIFAKAGTNIQYSTSGYASVGGTSMQFAVHIRLEQL